MVKILGRMAEWLIASTLKVDNPQDSGVQIPLLPLCAYRTAAQSTSAFQAENKSSSLFRRMMTLSSVEERHSDKV